MSPIKIFLFLELWFGLTNWLLAAKYSNSWTASCQLYLLLSTGQVQYSGLSRSLILLNPLYTAVAGNNAEESFDTEKKC